MIGISKKLFFSLIVLTVLFFILLPLSAMGASISGFSGALEHGGELIINGTGFGSKQNATPIKWETFESYTAGGHILNKGTTPQWTSTGDSTSQPTVVNTKSHGGNKAVYSDFPLNDNDCSFTFAQIDFPDTLDLYASYWVYWDNTIGRDLSNQRADFFKMNRFNTDKEYSGAPALKPAFWVDYGIPEGNGSPRGYLVYQVLNDSRNTNSYITWKTGGTNNFTHGSWHRLEMFVHLSDPPGNTDGKVEWRIDCQPVDVHIDAGNPSITRVAGDTKMFNIFLMELSGCGFSVSGKPYMWQDDIYVDNTRARVEIGDSSNWNSCNHREIQIPLEWNDSGTQIKISVNKGSFDKLDDKYLFVVDKEGAVSSFPLGDPVRDFKKEQ